MKYCEVPFKDWDDDPVPSWIEAIPSLEEHEDALRWLVTASRHTYREAVSDWLRRNDPEWRLPRRLPRVGPSVYGADAGAGLDWGEWWREVYGRERSNPGTARTGSKSVPITPLVPVYQLMARWWPGVVGEEFNPNFRHGIEDLTASAQAATLNPAGLLFLVVAQDMAGYSFTHCLNLHKNLSKRRRRRQRGRD